MDFNLAVVTNETQLPELVHEEIDPPASRAYCDDSDYLTNIPVLNDVTPRHSIRFRGDVVIDIELARKLCCDVVEAPRDSAREQELLNLLQAVLNEDDKQVRIRMALLNWQATPIC